MLISKKKKKVLFIHHGGCKGGAPRSLSFLVNRIENEEYEPFVLCGMDEAGNRKLFESVGAKYIYEKGIGPWHGSTVAKVSVGTLFWNPIFALFTIFQLPKVLKEVKPDIGHLNSTCLWVSAKVVKKYNKSIPVICHVREPLLPGFWGNIFSRIDHFKVDINRLKSEIIFS